MTRKHPFTSLLFLAGLALSVALTGCGGNGEATTTTILPPTAATTAPPALDPATVAPATDATTTHGGTPAPTPAAGRGVGTAVCTLLNLNTLTQDQLLAAIPNFPTRMVREFLEYRPYSSIQQFRQEIGKYVDAGQVTEWEKYVFVPIDPNTADTATLQQLPGVDATVAAALTGGRPYASNDAFLQALTSHLTAEQLAAAGCYLASQ